MTKFLIKVYGYNPLYCFNRNIFNISSVVISISYKELQLKLHAYILTKIKKNIPCRNKKLQENQQNSVYYETE